MILYPPFFALILYFGGYEVSRKASLLTQQDVPAYIKEIVKRLHPVHMEYQDEEGNWYGYVFRLDAKWKCGYESQLKKDVEMLVKWCDSWYAYSKLIEYKWWQTDVPTAGKYDFAGTKQHKQKALRSGWRNHAYLVISDPVAYRLEKDRFYRA